MELQLTYKGAADRIVECLEAYEISVASLRALSEDLGFTSDQVGEIILHSGGRLVLVNDLVFLTQYVGWDVISNTEVAINKKIAALTKHLQEVLSLAYYARGH